MQILYFVLRLLAGVAFCFSIPFLLFCVYVDNYVGAAVQFSISCLVVFLVSKVAEDCDEIRKSLGSVGPRKTR